MSEIGKFIGPLTEDALKQAGEEAGIYYQCDIAHEIARERTGREMAQFALVEAMSKLENNKIDQMTGLYRRDAFIEEASNRIKKTSRYSSRRTDGVDSALFIMLDIIGLHDINNQGGQAAGDEAIKATSDLLKRISRIPEVDIAGRLGGDEFALLMFYKREQGIITDKKMIARVHRRMERARKIDDKADQRIPGLRFDYITVNYSQTVLSVEDLFPQVDPKRTGASPKLSISQKAHQLTV